MKLLSAIVGYLGVQAGKEEDDAQCARAMTFPGYENCRCSDVFWKGGKQSRVTYQDSTSAMFMSSIPDNAGSWRFRDESHAAFDPNYSIILQFVRKNCGVSFLTEVAAGNVKFEFMDQYAAYSGTTFQSQVEKFSAGSDYFANGNVPAKKMETVTVQGFSGNTLQSMPQLHNAAKMRGDIPYDAKNDAVVVKKDQVLVYVTGLETVTFTDAQRDACLAGAMVGVMQGSEEEDATECMGLAHLYWV